MRSVLAIRMSLVAFVFLITVTIATLRADDAVSARQPLGDGESGILMLQDGGVLSGKITRAADWYMVERGAGQMQIAQSRVQLVCRTMQEAYEFRRQQMDAKKPADHLRLADWCIRYELRAEAARELAAARELDPDQPRLALLERRLEKGASTPVAKQSVYLEGAKASAKPQADRGALQGNVHASDLPSGAVELFTRKVQPVLVNNCTLSGCHQTGGKLSFQLDRAILRGEANRRSTMRNLEATLALVDRAHPDQSPLLTVPRKTHGGTTGPSFGPRQEQALKHVVDWVALVAPSESAPAVVDAPADAASTRAVAPSVQSASKTDNESAKRQLTSQADDESLMTLKSPHRLQVGVQLQSWQPRDEFDPEIFNRRMRAQGREQVAPSAAQPSTKETAPTAEMP